ncbi:calaxin isoform X4 [Callithrix jacchus]
MNRKKLQKLTDTLTKNCKHFNKFEVNCLIRLFYNLVGGVERQGLIIGLDRNAFRNILHVTFGMTDDMIMDRDCFEVFDLNGDGFISKEEMFHMLKNSLLKQPTEEDPDEGIKDLVEITLKKMDHDHDGKLSFADYELAVRKETLLLEAFGPCLPDPKVLIARWNLKLKYSKIQMNSMICEYLNVYIVSKRSWMYIEKSLKLLDFL